MSASSMTQIILQAVSWWGSQLAMVPLPKETIDAFERSLYDLLVKKLTDHWFPEHPLKGQGYRSIILDKNGRPDPILLQSAKAAGIPNLHSCFSYVESIVMWIDPHEVAVRTYWVYSQGGKEQVIYKSKSQLSGSDSPLAPSPTSSIGMSRDIPRVKTPGLGGSLPSERPATPPGLVGVANLASAVSPSQQSSIVLHPLSQPFTPVKASTPPPYSATSRGYSPLVYPSPSTPPQYYAPAASSPSSYKWNTRAVWPDPKRIAMTHSHLHSHSIPLTHPHLSLNDSSDLVTPPEGSQHYQIKQIQIQPSKMQDQKDQNVIYSTGEWDSAMPLEAQA